MVGDFSGGTATRFISILASDDVVDEEDEQFTVILDVSDWCGRGSIQSG